MKVLRYVIDTYQDEHKLDFTTCAAAAETADNEEDSANDDASECNAI